MLVVTFNRGVEVINTNLLLKCSYWWLPSSPFCFLSSPLLLSYHPSTAYSILWPHGLVFLFSLKDSFKCFLESWLMLTNSFTFFIVESFQFSFDFFFPFDGYSTLG